MKFKIRFLFLIFALAICASALCACSDTGIAELRFPDDRVVKTEFEPDEAFPDVKIIAVATSGKKSEISVSSGMLRGFDTSLSTGEEKEYTISYMGKKLTGKYTVSGDVNTRIRLKASATVENGEKVVTVSATGFSGDGFYAISGQVSYVGAIVGELVIESAQPSYTAETASDGNKTAFALYNGNCDDRTASDRVLFKIRLKTVDGAAVLLTIGGKNGYYIEMSEGKGIYRAPSLTIEV